MAEPRASHLGAWKTGFHPRSADMRIRSLGRVHLQLGEALRLEMTSADPGSADVVHLQYYIATELGPWALWLSGTADETAASEASLRELRPPFAE